ncbi:MAG: hypothetical protein AAFQ43_11435, partial [Bacteroidota bacterium]
MNGPRSLLLWGLALATALGCGDPPEASGETVVELDPMVTGTPSSPGAFHAATAPRPTVAPGAGWDTLWTALGKTPLGPDQMMRVGPFPEDVSALDDTDVSVTGYMMPLDASAAPTRFLLV